MSQLITPRTLAGFLDHLPESMMAREQLIETARQVFRSYGFAPIDTPALEYLEILEGKAGDESNKQMYRFQDHGGRHVALRFDLTVPLARFVAQHASTVGLPFKRYQIAKVWRGERAQRGRYREFMQCDFDTVGTRSVAADIETALVIHDLLQALGIRAFTIHLNHRMILNGLLDKLGLAAQANSVLRALDKLAKVGADAVADEMVAAAGATRPQAEQVLQFAQLHGDGEQLIADLGPLVAGNALGEQGVERLAETWSGIRAAGVDARHVELDLAIARGLDYYTGIVYETILDELTSIGSVCSGGRYDDLAGLYTRQELPGVGASLGLDRLLAALDELNQRDGTRTPAPVMVAYFQADRLNDYLALAAALRAAGIGVELYPEPKKLGKQLKYADQRGFRVAVIAGEDEFNTGTCRVKDLGAEKGSQTNEREVSIAAGTEGLVASIKAILDNDRPRSVAADQSTLG